MGSAAGGESYLLGRVAVKELNPLVPLGHVVRVLAQHDTVEQLGAARDEELKTLQPGGRERGRRVREPD